MIIYKCTYIYIYNTCVYIYIHTYTYTYTSNDNNDGGLEAERRADSGLALRQAGSPGLLRHCTPELTKVNIHLNKTLTFPMTNHLGSGTPLENVMGI